MESETFAETQHFLDNLCGIGVKLGLENTRALLGLLGQPQERVRAIHVAGTNGKGSVCSLLSSGLTARGLRAGLYTSPHLVSVRERLRIAGEAIDEASFVAVAQSIRADARALFPDQGETATYFEFMTAMAWRWFAEQGCDYAIMEVGMGGRLDSTNVCQPAVCVITSIGMDHVRPLGGTLASIAGEKAGILKPGVPLVCGVQQGEALAVIRARAEALGCPVWQLGEQFEVLSRQPSQLGQRVVLRVLDEIETHDIRLLGGHQASNLAVAVATMHRLGLERDVDVSRCLWPARLEWLDGQTLLDGAHNLEALEELLAALPEGERFSVLYATMCDKEWQQMLRKLSPHMRELYVTQTPQQRCLPAHEVAGFAREAFPGLPVVELPEVGEAVKCLRRAAPPALILGSLYLAGEIYPHFRGGTVPPIMAGGSDLHAGDARSSA